MEKDEEYVEFRVDNTARFQLLQHTFRKIKEDKDAKKVGEGKDYLPLLDREARIYFHWSTNEESWDFDSLIMAFHEGDYSFTECKMTGPKTGRLTFQSFGYPYGGTDSMQALIEAFGFKITRVQDDYHPARIF